MAQIGFLTLPFLGHLLPALSLAKGLQDRGHDIVFFNVPGVRDEITSHGFRFVKLSGVINATDELDGTIEFGRMVYESLPAFIRPPDALIVDQLFPLGATVDQYLGIPYVTFPSPTSISRSLQRWTDAENVQRTALGLEPYNDVLEDSVSPIHIVEWPKAFDVPHQHPVYNVGPVTHPATRPKVGFPHLDGRPLIYATMGTMKNAKPWIYRVIMQVCSKIDVQVVLTLGSSDLQFDRVPENVILVKYAPQFQLLERAVACISNAGHNTTLDCLTQGVPMVAVPLGHDQPGTATRIRQTQTGRTIPLQDFYAGRLREALSDVLNNPRYRQNVGELRRQIAAMNPLKTACEIVERCLAA